MALKLPHGHASRHFETIDSTNAEAHRCAEAGEGGPLWLWADRQTRGRGRLGRSWMSEPGNLYATFLFTTAAPPQVAAQASFVAALAVRDTAGALLGTQAGLALKWPNDVLRDGAKFCGILPEIVRLNGRGTCVSLGIGINLAHVPEGLAYPVTRLGPFAPALALESLAHTLDRRLALWNEGASFAVIRQAWLEHAVGLNGPASAQVNGHEIQGLFAGLADDGALMLRGSDGRTVSIHAGEVRFAELERLRAR